VAGPFLLVVLHAAVRDLEGRPGWLLTRRWMVFAGEASSAVHLVRELVLPDVQEAPAAPPAVVAAVVTALGVLTAVLLHVLVERPADRWLRNGSPSVAPAVPPAGGPGTGPHEGPGRGRLPAL
jgi:peptidoglycan/LPS O-acetylase OafA/YrhL